MSNVFSVLLEYRLANKENIIKDFTENIKKVVKEEGTIFNISYSIHIICREGKIYEYHDDTMRIFDNVADFLENQFAYLFEVREIRNYKLEKRDNYLDFLAEQNIAKITERENLLYANEYIFKFSCNFRGKEFEFVGFNDQINTLFFYTNETLIKLLSSHGIYVYCSLGTKYDEVKKEFIEKKELNKEFVF